ncbi:MAG: hypothetical protein U1E73_13895 [Planctomycetota bacterium]
MGIQAHVVSSFALSCFVFAAAPLRGQCPLQWIAAPRDMPQVDVAVPWDPDGPGPQAPRIAIGGTFLYIEGQVSIHAASYVPGVNAFGTLYGLGYGAGSQITQLCALPNGDLVAGGTFSLTLTYPTDHIARRDATGWHGLGTGLPSAPTALAPLPNGWVAAAGSYTGNVLGFDGASWSPLGGGANGSVQALTSLPNGDLVAGGSFQVVGGVAANYIARWDGTAWHALGAGAPGIVRRLAAFANGDVAAIYQQSTAWYVVRWDGSAWTQLGPSLPSQPDGVFVDAGDRLHVWLGQQSGPYLQRWDGTNWVPMPVIAGGMRAIVPMPDGQLVAFSRLAYNPIWVFQGSTWVPRPTGVNGGVRAIATASSGRLYAGGAMSGYAASSDGGPFLASWTLNAPVLALCPTGAAASSSVYAGGTFTATTTAIPLNGIAQLQSSGWAPLGSGMDAPVKALALLPNGDLLAGGSFVLAGGVTGNRIARWDGTAWHALGTGMNSEVLALAVAANGDVYAGGYFTMAGGVPANRVARWDGAAWHALGSGTNIGVHGLAVTAAGDVIAVGDFTTAGGIAANHIARWNGAAWHPIGLGFDLRANAVLVLPNGHLVAGGDFLLADNATARHVAYWNGSAWSEPAGAGVDAPVYALGQWPNGEVLIGGDFTHVGGFNAYGLATLRSTCMPATAPLANSCQGTVPIVLAATSLPFVGGTFGSRATGFVPGALGVALVGLTSPAVSLGTVFPMATPGCKLLASPDSILLVLPQNGVATWQFAIPGSTAFLGLRLYNQFLQLTISSQGDLTSVESSNALALVLGAL